MDMHEVARELLLAIRGHRSQTAFSRRLGYRSNVAYAWEAGRRWPTGAETFRACHRTGIDVRGALVTFLGREPGWLDDRDPWSPDTVALLLDDLRGNTSVTELAQRSGLGRSRVSRWLGGHTEPRLPDLLRLVEAASARAVDLVAAFVDPMKLPSIAGVWERLEARRQGAGRFPWTQAVLRALELDAYLALPAHVPGWISQNLGISREEEDRCIEFLVQTGQVVEDGPCLRGDVMAVDTRRSPEVGRRLKSHWAREAARRVEEGHPGQFSYNVFTVSAADFDRIREAHLAYFHALRAIVASSEPGEVVAVANVQLFALAEGAAEG
jgi:transcriptional regulator with XRE-family HTH domain